MHSLARDERSRSGDFDEPRREQLLEALGRTPGTRPEEFLLQRANGSGIEPLRIHRLLSG